MTKPLTSKLNSFHVGDKPDKTCHLNWPSGWVFPYSEPLPHLWKPPRPSSSEPGFLSSLGCCFLHSGLQLTLFLKIPGPSQPIDSPGILVSPSGETSLWFWRASRPFVNYTFLLTGSARSNSYLMELHREMTFLTIFHMHLNNHVCVTIHRQLHSVGLFWRKWK